MIKIKRALISVFNKEKLENLAIFLQSYEVEIFASDGTKAYLQKKGISVKSAFELGADFEHFNGRVKTISSKVASSLLFDREKDKQEAEEMGIKPIDLVISSLYPFIEIKDKENDIDKLIENIDIGGVLLLRAAAKNFKYVTIINDINDYENLKSQMQKYDGATSYAFRFNLMKKVFQFTSYYDAAITQKFAKDENKIDFFEEKEELFYGENSHQKAFIQKAVSIDNYSLADIQIIKGEKISYNNILDIQSALLGIKNFSSPACCIIKHNNPCGLSVSNSLKEAFQLAWASDPVSAFGSVIAFNKPFTMKEANFLNLDDKENKKFVEIILAPDFDVEIIKYTEKLKKIRLIKFDPKIFAYSIESRSFMGIKLTQTIDDILFEELKIKTKRKIDLYSNLKLIEFGLICGRLLKSNAIVLVRRKKEAFQMIGFGCGQPNRVLSTKLAMLSARDFLQKENPSENYIKEELENSILISDAFFPFADSIEFAKENNIKTIVQPGGSIRDKKVLSFCDENDICMIFCKNRHFRH